MSIRKVILEESQVLYDLEAALENLIEEEKKINQFLKESFTFDSLTSLSSAFIQGYGPRIPGIHSAPHQEEEINPMQSSVSNSFLCSFNLLAPSQLASSSSNTSISSITNSIKVLDSDSECLDIVLAGEPFPKDLVNLIITKDILAYNKVNPLFLSLSSVYNSSFLIKSLMASGSSSNTGSSSSLLSPQKLNSGSSLSLNPPELTLDQGVDPNFKLLRLHGEDSFTFLHRLIVRLASLHQLHSTVYMNNFLPLFQALLKNRASKKKLENAQLKIELKLSQLRDFSQTQTVASDSMIALCPPSVLEEKSLRTIESTSTLTPDGHSFSPTPHPSTGTLLSEDEIEKKRANINSPSSSLRDLSIPSSSSPLALSAHTTPEEAHSPSLLSSSSAAEDQVDEYLILKVITENLNSASSSSSTVDSPSSSVLGPSKLTTSSSISSPPQKISPRAPPAVNSAYSSSFKISPTKSSQLRLNLSHERKKKENSLSLLPRELTNKKHQELREILQTLKNDLLNKSKMASSSTTSTPHKTGLASIDTLLNEERKIITIISHYLEHPLSNLSQENICETLARGLKVRALRKKLETEGESNEEDKKKSPLSPKERAANPNPNLSHGMLSSRARHLYHPIPPASSRSPSNPQQPPPGRVPPQRQVQGQGQLQGQAPPPGQRQPPRDQPYMPPKGNYAPRGQPRPVYPSAPSSVSDLSPPPPPPPESMPPHFTQQQPRGPPRGPPGQSRPVQAVGTNNPPRPTSQQETVKVESSQQEPAHQKDSATLSEESTASQKSSPSKSENLPYKTNYTRDGHLIRSTNVSPSKSSSSQAPSSHASVSTTSLSSDIHCLAEELNALKLAKNHTKESNATIRNLMTKLKKLSSDLERKINESDSESLGELEQSFDRHSRIDDVNNSLLDLTRLIRHQQTEIDHLIRQQALLEKSISQPASDKRTPKNSPPRSSSSSTSRSKSDSSVSSNTKAPNVTPIKTAFSITPSATPKGSPKQTTPQRQEEEKEPLLSSPVSKEGQVLSQEDLHIASLLNQINKFSSYDPVLFPETLSFLQVKKKWCEERLQELSLGQVSPPTPMCQPFLSLKVDILKAKNLPEMKRMTRTTDSFVEVICLTSSLPYFDKLSSLDLNTLVSEISDVDHDILTGNTSLKFRDACVSSPEGYSSVAWRDSLEIRKYFRSTVAKESVFPEWDEYFNLDGRDFSTQLLLFFVKNPNKNNEIIGQHTFVLSSSLYLKCLNSLSVFSPTTSLGGSSSPLASKTNAHQYKLKLSLPVQPKKTRSPLPPNCQLTISLRLNFSMKNFLNLLAAEAEKISESLRQKQGLSSTQSLVSVLKNFNFYNQHLSSLFLTSAPTSSDTTAAVTTHLPSSSSSAPAAMTTGPKKPTKIIGLREREKLEQAKSFALRSYGSSKPSPTEKNRVSSTLNMSAAVTPSSKRARLQSPQTTAAFFPAPTPTASKLMTIDELRATPASDFTTATSAPVTPVNFSIFKGNGRK